MLAEKTGIIATDLTPLIGTEIKADAETLLGGAFAKDIRALLERRGVLLFRDLHFTDEEQVAFTQTLGELAYEYNGAEIDGKRHAIAKVSLDPTVSPTAEGLKSSLFWHLDGSMSETPILASLLTPRVLAPSGGQTEFCNTYAAYEALSAADKEAIGGLKVVHANWARAYNVDTEPSYEAFKRSRMGPSETQPLVWKHRSGRKSLVVGATAAYVVGLQPVESLDLLVRLRDWATQPQFVYHHEWRMGDLIIWDNTGTLHRALPYDPLCGRLMHRTMLKGEEPFA